MALIKCPECGKEISDKARVCVNCGCPISEYIEEKKEDNQKKFEYLKERQVAEKTFSSEVRKINYVKDKKKPRYAPVRMALSVFLVIYAIVWCVAMFSDPDGTSTRTDSTLIEDSQQEQENKVDSNEKEEGSEQEQENEAGNNEKKKDAE